jgi:hypothetical protein
MGDSPFTGDAHPTIDLRANIEEDLRHSRRKLDFVIARLRDTAADMRSTTGKDAFIEADVAGLLRIVSRLESAAAELVAAGY